MDIRKELVQITEDSNYAENLVEGIAFQLEELVKKSYLFKVIAFANTMEKVVESGLFKEESVKYIVPECFYAGNEYTGNKGCEFGCSLIDDKGRTFVQDSSGGYTQSAKIIRSALNKVEGFSAELVNDKFLGVDHRLELTIGIGEKIIDLFLNEELKKIYDYNKMQLEVPNYNDSSTKKLKM